jgi:hypothetical protein
MAGVGVGVSRVARFLSTQYTKTGVKIPNLFLNYQMPIKCTKSRSLFKIAKKIPTFSHQKALKFGILGLKRNNLATPGVCCLNFCVNSRVESFSTSDILTPRTASSRDRFIKTPFRSKRFRTKFCRSMYSR